MIFYFTGTGNSWYAARSLAQILGDELVSVAQAMHRSAGRPVISLTEDECLGFVFPVYAWAPPRMVLGLISSMEITGGNPYTFALCTCGDEEGRTTPILRKVLDQKGITLNAAFSLVMPNNYILSYDVDPEPVALKKLEQADERLPAIGARIRERADVCETRVGRMADLKSYLINPLFNRFAMNPARFFATDACTGCGLCEQVCPAGIITVRQKPSWGKDCTHCLACIHSCPVQAIQYGRSTAGKGRYLHPARARALSGQDQA